MVVVEDVVTSGGQVATSVEQLRDLGLVVQHAVCVVDREQSGRELLRRAGCALVSLFTGTELEKAVAGDRI